MIVGVGGGGVGGGFGLSCIPAHVNYLLFALDKPEARWFPPVMKALNHRAASINRKKAAEIK